MRKQCKINEQDQGGLRAIVVENDMLRVVILPEAGGRIWQICYKPLATDLLWNNPQILPSRKPLGSHFDDTWAGGWDDLFPNDQEATINGEDYPDHGELWTGSWDAEGFSSEGEARITLSFTTPISGIEIEKTIFMGENGRLRLQHRLTNKGQRPFPFLWKLHPALRVTPAHRLDFPKMQVVLDPEFPGSLEGAAPEFAWPYARTHQEIDLRCVPPCEQRELYFFYGTRMESGWCALTDTSTKLACGFRFALEVFSSCCVFASYGGWRDLNVVVLEPCTGYPLNFDAMRKAGRHKVLAASETLHTDVLFTVQEGIGSVAYMDEEGNMSEEPAVTLP